MKDYTAAVYVLVNSNQLTSIPNDAITLEIATRFPDQWRRDETGSEKDLVYISDHQFSTEIKCSSSKNKIFANRSYAQRPTDSKKSKSGYYIAINFEKFGEREGLPKLRLIRFGWLDHSDWIPQRASTGQQARLEPDSDTFDHGPHQPGCGLS